MKDTLADVSHELFFDLSGKNPSEIDIFFEESIDYPKISKTPRITITIPLPREYGGKYHLLGYEFAEYETNHESIWTLYAGILVKFAAYVHNIEYLDLEDWKKNKTSKLCEKVIQFIGNTLAENHLQMNYPEYKIELDNIENKIAEINFDSNSKQIETRKKFASQFAVNKTSIQELKTKIIQDKESKAKIIEYADFLYRHQDYLKDTVFPFYDEKELSFKNKNKTIFIKPKSEFKKLVDSFDEMWIDEKIKKARITKKYDKITKDLNFDKIGFADENIGEYLRLKNESSMFLKKLRTQLKMVANIVDDPNAEDLGLVEMQKAIQAMASQNDSIQIFEQDVARKTDENWAIILDTSASMKLKFEDLKKFALCLSETADEMNSRGGQWGLFSFNNEFLIVKDHSEKYTQMAKARIGGIKNKGLSFIPDAITLGARIMQDDPTDKKFIFVITDGQTLGQDQDEKAFQDAIKQARNMGINVIGIGLPEKISKYFTLNIPHGDLKKTVAKFIDAYIEVAQSSM
ncbi:VWA domain-containing protein [Nitrosopumilus sp. K4]|uniref:vWA domain-containing protein n=1 Tax=Nitrosopumilus sp. K4 TaxID=2795383 RepID=UPI001BAE34CC|nr:vWA domain-containing protein [Nitrosopumilus sp. K4]QUC65458.1 VWA domain-containing protein [Nitrosopumilus sp. K4]